ncbi:sensor domain-containing diguanylate cyclase [Candidatus Magnetomonas plexicatena]|uniref:sensor domain-containing diguanylate cyclase n=1 Tax=Candidatus Magnetomonas plexicatena TaxID=2552947 RepID=UPI001C74BA78|nr:diguanylate cyclase [Nitrospirales bacterium LBB_01]
MDEREKTKEDLLRELEELKDNLFYYEEKARKCKECEANLKETETRFMLMADSAPVFIWMSEADGKRSYFNKVWLDYTGRTIEEESGNSWINNIHDDDRDKFEEFYKSHLELKEAYKIEYRLRRKDGVYRWILETGTPRHCINSEFNGFIGSAVGITERKEAEERLHYIAHHDMLTGLPNRMLFFDRLNNFIEQAKRYNHMLALLFLDLNRFKAVNDLYGHHIGDMLLKETAHRINDCIRKSDTLARMGGDEFNIILSRIAGKQDPTSVALKIIESLTKPFLIEGHECSVGTSIGISIYPLNASEAAVLIKKADEAMYKAKEKRTSAYEFCSG